MPDVLLRGMTWDHRRAVEPLVGTRDAFRAQNPGIDVKWRARPLHGFEFTPIEDLARDYDLIIFDHPFAGAIAETGCLLPLDEIAAGMSDAFVGPSLQSYIHSGKLWAAPVDAACQVAVSRPDLMAELAAEPPADWEAVLALGECARAKGKYLAIGFRGVHALMTFMTLCANLGRPLAERPECGAALNRATSSEALDLMRRLLALATPDCLDWNSIDLHEAMSARDDLVFCPAVYCYATYAEADRVKPLRFHDLPGPRGVAGSTVGGTGLGISAHCQSPEAALAYARFVAMRSTQSEFARHHGQPARVECWDDPSVDALFAGAFRNTRRTMDAGWVRPRHRGYLGFQAAASEWIEAHLRGEMSENALFDALRRRYDQTGAA